MLKDRDLGILGAGALAAVFCLFLPLPFGGKAALGLGVLVVFMALALLRAGSDRVPLEVWLKRRLRYFWSTRRFVFQKDSAPLQLPPRPAPAPAAAPAPAFVWPVSLALEDGRAGQLVTVGLGTTGLYFLAWLAQGGGSELARLMAQLLPGS